MSTRLQPQHQLISISFMHFMLNLCLSNAFAQPGQPKTQHSVPFVASMAVLWTLLPHEVITAVALGLNLVLLAGHAISLARLLLVDGLFLLGLELCVNLGAFRGLVAVVLGRKCRVLLG